MKNKIKYFKEMNMENFSHPAELVQEEMRREADKLVDRTVKFVLELKELKDLIIAGDNMREELSNYWGGSYAETEWLDAVIKLKKLGIIDEN